MPPDFRRYKAVSRQIHSIFARHTSLVEPLSLDEAYLDVTAPSSGLPSATAVAEAIRAAIRAETGLTASAGVAPNKFIAKIASDFHKPDGLMVVRPRDVLTFLAPLEVARLPGVGKVMQHKLAALGIQSILDLRRHPAAELEQRFGRYGLRLHDFARGIDERPVQSDRPTLQVSAEDTFEHDLHLDELEPAIRQLADHVWAAHQREAAGEHGRVARTVVLKLKTADFHILTRSLTPATRPASAREVGDIACALRERAARPPTTRYRLVGVGLAGFVDRDAWAAQFDLFEMAR